MDRRDNAPEKTELPSLTEDQLRLINEFVPMHVSYVDRELRYRFVNRAYEATYGRPARELIGRHMAEVLSAESFKEAEPDIAKVLSGETVSVERRITSTPLGTRYFIGNYVPDVAPDGGVEGFLVVVQDVTEQKCSAQALKESEEKFRGLFETSRDGIGFYTLDGQIEDANLALCKTHGYDLEELKGKTYQELTPERWHAVDDTAMQELWQRDYSDEFEKEYRRADGSFIPVSLRCWLIRDENGEPLRLMAMIRDITEQKQAQNRLQQAEERLKFALEGSNDGLWDWNVQTGHLYISPRWASMLGYRSGELEHHISTWERMVHPDDKERVLSALERHLEGGTSHYTAQIRMRAKWGDWVWVLTRGKVVARDAEGNPLRATGTHTDITVLKRAEVALHRSKQAAELANRAKSEFLANMSHELRTPLNAIIGFADVIKTETLGPLGNPKYGEYITDISESGHHLLDLINDILDLSRIEAGKVVLCEEYVDVQALIRSCVTLTKERARSGKVALIEEVSGSQQLAVRADARMMKQILINLLSNAVKFTRPGGKVTIRRWASVEHGLVLQIADTGIGMEADDIPKALRRFEQVDSSLSRNFQGSGLGLPLAKSLVELHGGVLDLQSEVGVGTTVTVRLPAQRIERADVGARAAS